MVATGLADAPHLSGSNSPPVPVKQACKHNLPKLPIAFPSSLRYYLDGIHLCRVAAGPN